MHTNVVVIDFRCRWEDLVRSLLETFLSVLVVVMIRGYSILREINLLGCRTMAQVDFLHEGSLLGLDHRTGFFLRS